MNNLYLYDGPVYRFEKLFIARWRAFTWAASERQAKSNLTIRCKQEHGLLPSAKLNLPDKVRLVQ